MHTYSVTEYEAKNGKLRRTEKELAIPRLIREDLLLEEWNVSPEEMAAAVRGVLRVKNQRRQTIHHDKTGWGKLDKTLKRSGSALLLVLGLQSSETSNATVQAKELVQKHEQAAKLQAAADQNADPSDHGTLPVNPADYDNFDNALYYRERSKHKRSSLALDPTPHAPIAPQFDAYIKPEAPQPSSPVKDDAYLASLANKLWTTASQRRAHEDTKAEPKSHARSRVQAAVTHQHDTQATRSSPYRYPPTFPPQPITDENDEEEDARTEYYLGPNGLERVGEDSEPDSDIDFDDGISAITSGTGLHF
jgi:hypothetical protein